MNPFLTVAGDISSYFTLPDNIDRNTKKGVKSRHLRSEDKQPLVSVGQISQRLKVYFQTNKRKLCRQRCENSQQSPPLCFLCWLNFTTSSGPVSPRSDVALGRFDAEQRRWVLFQSGIVCWSSSCQN